MFNLPEACLVVMWSLLGVLVFSSGVCFCLGLKNKDKDYTELKQRIVSWWWMIGVLFLALSLGTGVSIVFFGFLSYLAFKEFMSIVPTRQCDRRVVFWAYVAIPIQFYWVYIGWYELFTIFVPLFLFLFMPMRMVLIGETRGFIRSIGVMQWGVMLTVFGLSHIAYLLVVPLKDYEGSGIGLVLFLLVMTQLNDVSQYVWGKCFGKHKIIPKVSPNKTVEGFLGGVFTISLVSFYVSPYLTPLSGVNGLLAGVVISFSGFIGDVVLSSVKRDLAIKDTGQLIPGHGGILDRLDSLMYTAPLYFHFLVFVAYRQ